MTKGNYFALLILPFLFSFLTHSQTSEIESAKLAVDTLFFSDKGKALEISEKYIPISKTLNDTFYVTYFLDQAGELNRFGGNLHRAENQLKECLEYKVDWEDFQDLSITYNNLGKTYKMMGDFELAFFNFLEALKLMEESDNLFGQGYYLNNIGTLFDDQQNYPKAIEYYNRSYEIKKITQDSSGMASTSYNAGISYYNMGNLDKALSYYYQSYNSTSYQNLADKRIRALNSIAQTLIQKGEHEKAGDYLKSALPYLDKIDDQVLNPRLFLTLSEVHLINNLKDSALFYNKLALNNSEGRGNSKIIQDILFGRAKIYEKYGEFDSAFKYLNKAELYYDSLVYEANIHAVAEMESKYNSEKNLRLRKEAELEAFETNIELQEKELQLLYLLLTLVAALGIAILIFVKYRAKRRNSELLLGQKILIEKRNNELNDLNERLHKELSDLKVNTQEQEVILSKVFNKPEVTDLPEELKSLSPREMEVLANLALGLSNDQLAEKLFVSKTTIKTHLQRIYSKLLIKNRAQAVSIAHQYGIIDDSQKSA